MSTTTQEALRAAEIGLANMVSYQSANKLPTIHEYGQARRALDAVRAALAAQPPTVAAAVPEGLRDAAEAFLEAQTALDNRELVGINGEPYDVLRRRVNAAREELELALAATPSPAPAAAQADAYVECRECDDCGHVGINDSHEAHAACSECGWGGPSPAEDKCPSCNRVGAMSAACPKCSGHYHLKASTQLRPTPAAAQADDVTADGNVLTLPLPLLEARGLVPVFRTSQPNAVAAQAQEDVHVCRVCGGSGKVTQYTSAGAPTPTVPCFNCKGKGRIVAGQGVCPTVSGCSAHGCHGTCLPVEDTHPAPAEAVGAQRAEVRGLTQAATDVLAERQRQVSAEGWMPEHDDEHHYGQLAAAAGCYALFARSHPTSGRCPGEWPWNAEWWKPGGYRRALEKAGALILAEIERLDRARGITPPAATTTSAQADASRRAQGQQAHGEA